jgi:hypothetical protein
MPYIVVIFLLMNDSVLELDCAFDLINYSV